MQGRWFSALFLWENNLAIPDYESIMAPLLRLLSRRGLLSLAEAVGLLADEFELSPDERAVLLPSGQNPLFRNRVGWAKTYLKQAGLIVQPKRAFLELSSSGKELIPTLPAKIDSTFLERYPSFIEFVSRSGARSMQKAGTESSNVQSVESAAVAIRGLSAGNEATPEEVIESSIRTLHDELRAELLETVKAAAPDFFERVVVQLLLKLGYGGSRQEAGKTVGRSGDGGIDGIINEDRLGLDAIYLQPNVGRAWSVAPRS